MKTNLIRKTLEILDIKINRYLINGSYWDLTKENERPSVYAFEYPTINGEIEDDKPSNGKTVLITLVSLGAILTLGAGIFAGITLVKRKKS